MPDAGPPPTRSIAPYFYLLRVPLLCGAVLVLLPGVALATAASSFLEGLFDLTPLRLAIVTLVALLEAWVVLITACLILLYGQLRFEVRSLGIDDVPGARHFALAGLLATPMVGAAARVSAENGGQHPGTLAGAVVAGIAVAAGLLWLVAQAWRRMSGAFKPRPGSIRDRLRRWLGRHPQLSAGYLSESGRILPGHGAALVLLGMTLVIYVAITTITGCRR